MIGYMPFAPMSKASKFYVTNQIRPSIMFPKCFHCFFMSSQKLFVTVIRCESFSESCIVPLSCMPCFLIQPLGNVHMSAVSRNITHKSKYHVLSFCLPSCHLIFRIDRIPGKLPFHRLKFRPGNIHIQKRHIPPDTFIPRTWCISHKRISKHFFCFLVCLLFFSKKFHKQIFLGKQSQMHCSILFLFCQNQFRNWHH